MHLRLATLVAAIAMSAALTAADGQVYLQIGPQQPPFLQPPPGSGFGAWIPCAPEDAFCYVPYTTTVRYGANGRYFSRLVSGPILCSNQTFGDPLVGVAKQCEFLSDGAPGPVPALNYCANEGSFCGFSGSALVVYGSGERLTSGYFTNGVPCTNDYFGDPAPGISKVCYIQQ